MGRKEGKIERIATEAGVDYLYLGEIPEDLDLPIDRVRIDRRYLSGGRRYYEIRGEEGTAPPVEISLDEIGRRRLAYFLLEDLDGE